MFKIITDEKELRKKNNTADLFESKFIINQLEETLKENNTGVGLAAPQIGIHKRVAIIRLKSDNVEEKIDLVNPIIIDMSGGYTFTNEGCLSLPGKKVNTKRYKEIFVKDDLHPAGFIAAGLIAAVISHETDHLNGILITDHDIVKKVGRNEPCPCGNLLNGKPVKYKHCHGK